MQLPPPIVLPTTVAISGVGAGRVVQLADGSQGLTAGAVGADARIVRSTGHTDLPGSTQVIDRGEAIVSL